ncbi:MAG: hypothetical protein ACLT98_16465 [Eggerthellaceae bacterium]
MPRRWRNAYFVRNGQLYTVAERIRSRVFLAQATSATTKSCAGRTTSSCAETSSSTSKPKFATGDRDIAPPLAPSSYLMLGHAEIIRERTLFEYQGNSVYRRQAKATNV